MTSTREIRIHIEDTSAPARKAEKPNELWPNRLGSILLKARLESLRISSASLKKDTTLQPAGSGEKVEIIPGDIAEEWVVPQETKVHEFKPLFPVNLEQALNSLIYGEEAIKLGCCGKPHVRKFFIDPEMMQELRWITPAKYEQDSKISVHAITAISFGFKTSLFRKHMENLKGKDDLAVSIKYLGKRGSKKDLNIVFMNPEHMRLFVTGLQYVILKEARGLVLSRSDHFDKKFLSDTWTKHQGQEVDLEADTVSKMLQSLNIGVYPRYFEQQAQIMSNPATGRLNHSDFLAIVHNLTEHTELNPVFEKYSKVPEEDQDENPVFNPTMSISRLMDFFKEVQKDPITLTECRALVQVASCFLYTEYGDLPTFAEGQKNPNTMRGLSERKFAKIREESERNILREQLSTETPSNLGLMGFSNLIFSRTNCLMNQAVPFQTDMNYPLSRYLINTSYYTYLKVNHETKMLDVSAENYTKYLLKGVRCIDISLIEGLDGSPAVGHKLLPTKSIPLQAVLNNVKKSAFVTSPYPVIIHLEVNCRATYQEKVIASIIETLGKENILILPESVAENNVTDLQSPEVLKGKYILKSIRPRLIPQKVKSADEELELDDCPDPEPINKESLLSPIAKKLAREVLEEDKSPAAEEKKLPSQTEKQLMQIMVAEKLVKYVYFVTGVQLDPRKFRYPWEVASISANKMEVLMQNNKEEGEWLYYTTEHLASVSPSLKLNPETFAISGYKTIDPSSLWKLGVQFAGIFRGMKDDATAVNDMLFNQGGSRCGYILKHPRLIQKKRSLVEPPAPRIARKMKVDLVSVNQIPLEENIDGEANFSMVVSIKGAKCDEKTFEFPFQSDGFRYIFEKEESNSWMMEFKLSYPLEAVIFISLHCEGKPLCKAAFSAISIREGYRIIPLCDLTYKRYAFSNILGKFEFVDEQP